MREMSITEREKKLKHAERMLKAVNTRIRRAETSRRLWERRVYQQRYALALQVAERNAAAKIAAATYMPTGRKFRD